LYIFCGEQLLYACLRTADQEAAAGMVDELAWLIPRIWEHRPHVRIILRGDSGFCREEFMNWYEANQVDCYVLGLAKNNHFKVVIGKAWSVKTNE
jgi:hypothetical protein